MSKAILQFTLQAVQLTESLQARVGSSTHGAAFSNVMLMMNNLIADEEQGKKLVVVNDGTVSTPSIADLFRAVSQSPIFQAAATQETRAVSLNEGQQNDIRLVGSYLEKNGFDKDKLSLPSVYLMAVVAAGELHERHHTSRDVVVLPQVVGKKIQEQQFWLR